MPATAADLVALLDLEPIELDIFRGDNRNIGTGRIFGGQVLAQALVAAARTVEGDRTLHSMHGYFILTGDLSIPVVYFVDRLRDGGSFSTRRVTGIQHGQAIFSMSSSFHRHEEGIQHQTEMPDVPEPESLRPELEMIRERADEIPEPFRAILTQDRPLDFRPTDGSDPFAKTVRPPTRSHWVRAIGPVDDNPVHHQALLAYASDYGLLDAALRPHGVNLRDPDMMVASLDHSIWFHRPVRMDEWMLYVAESPAASGARGFTRGTFFTRSGELVASVTQEGLVRRKRGT
jgi:acyl-CoA thioesterase-2